MSDDLPSPGMIGPSPSERGLPAVPANPKIHAQRFAREWEDVAETYVQRRMRELGIHELMIGSSDHENLVAHRAFFPDEGDGGGVSPGRRINVDSGVLNPDLHPVREWANATLRQRIDATIVHEYEEALRGDHDEAVERSPETELPVGGKVRKLLRAIRLSEQDIRGDDSSRLR